MPSLSSIKFSKFDKYDNPTFTATQKLDEINYTILEDLAHKLEQKDFQTFLPIYHNSQYNYTTIRFFKDPKHKLEEGCKYDINFTIKTKVKDNKTFVNCYFKAVKFVSRPPKVDEGDELEL